MQELKHETLQKFLDEVIKELECVNKYYKSRNEKELYIAELVAPLYYDLSRNVYKYVELINDLEQCDQSDPRIVNYGNDEERNMVTLVLCMSKIYSKYGDSYCPFNYKYELCFYKERDRFGKYEKYYHFSLRKIKCISCETVYLSSEEYEKFIDDFNTVGITEEYKL